jgi:hypothetical protein
MKGDPELMLIPALRIIFAGLLIMYSVSRLMAAFRDKGNITFVGTTYSRSKDPGKYFFAFFVHLWIIALMIYYILTDVKHL